MMSSIIKFLALAGLARATFNGFMCTCNDQNGNNVEATDDICPNFQEQGGYIDSDNVCVLPDGPPIQQQFLHFCQVSGKGGGCVGEGEYSGDSQSLAPPTKKRTPDFNSRILGPKNDARQACPSPQCSGNGDPWAVVFVHGDSSCGGALGFLTPTDGNVESTSSGCSFDPGPYDGFQYEGGQTCGGVGNGLLQTMQFYDSNAYPIGQYDFTIGTQGSCWSGGAVYYYSWSVNNGTN